MKFGMPATRATDLLIPCLVVLALSPTAESEANVLRVPSQYPRIQNAVLAASEGDSILVAPGDYVNNYFGPMMSMTLISEAGAESTFVTAGGAYIQLWDPFVTNAIKINGFTFRNCLDGVQVSAGGLAHGVEVEISDCHFINDGGTMDPSWEGAVRIWTEFTYTHQVLVDIHDCIFQDNRSLGWGAAIGIGGAARGDIRNNTFIGNSAVRGGGIGIEGANLYAGPPGIVIRDNLFEGNIATGDGGNAGNGAGISVWASRHVQITGNVFRGNKGANGGAVAVAEPRSSLVEITGNLMIGNRADDAGGAIASIQSLEGITLSQNTIVGSSGLRGGAIGVLSPAGLVKVENNIVANTIMGSGVFYAGNVSNIMTRCNDVWNTTPLFEGLVPAATDFSADPEFCDPNAGDYSIWASSPCAPENSPAKCGLIGAFDVGCGVVQVDEVAPAEPRARVTISPNPISFEAHIAVHGLRPGEAIEIVQATGRVIDVLRPQAGNKIHWYPSLDLPSGVYFARMRGDISDATRFVLVR